MSPRAEMMNVSDAPLTRGRFHSTRPGGGFLKYSDALVAGNSGSSNRVLLSMQSFLISE